MFETSQSTEKLDAALAKAQGEIEVALRDKTNPAYRSKYADITSAWESCRFALSHNAVSVTQWPIHTTDNRLHLLTRVAHAGEWMKATFSVPVTKQDPQGYGSAITYAKRFTLMAALGIVSEEESDDDGNASSGIEDKRPEVIAHKVFTKVAPPAVIPAPGADKRSGPSDAQLKRLHAIMTASFWTKDQCKEYCLRAFMKDTSTSLTKAEYELVCNVMQKQKYEQAIGDLHPAPADKDRPWDFVEEELDVK